MRINSDRGMLLLVLYLIFLSESIELLTFKCCISNLLSKLTKYKLKSGVFYSFSFSFISIRADGFFNLLSSISNYPDELSPSSPILSVIAIKIFFELLFLASKSEKRLLESFLYI